MSEYVNLRSPSYCLTDPRFTNLQDSPIIPPNTSPNETVNFVEARKNLHEVEDPNEPTKRSRASRQAGFGLKIQENPDGAARLKAAIQKKHEDRSLYPPPSFSLFTFPTISISPSAPFPTFRSAPCKLYTPFIVSVPSTSVSLKNTNYS